MFIVQQPSVNQHLPLKFPKGIQLHLKRTDLVHSTISGNKFYKLKKNLITAKAQDATTILTFGGAYSNHIAATAAAAHAYGFRTVGIIRGEELSGNFQSNPTLAQAHAHGMQLHFISRSDYQKKTNTDFIQHLASRFGVFYMIPEGGTNSLAVQGCEEILTLSDQQDFDYICCSVGTGGTIAGIINASSDGQKILGFPALKGDFLADEVRRWTVRSHWDLCLDYHFGGYAKTTPELLKFIFQFQQNTDIEIEPIYTGKMLFGIFDLIERGYFPKNSRILAIHTGGLQGNLSNRFIEKL